MHIKLKMSTNKKNNIHCVTILKYVAASHFKGMKYRFKSSDLVAKHALASLFIKHCYKKEKIVSLL